jgi:hypothetical protein
VCCLIELLRKGFDDVTAAADGINVPRWVCNDPQGRPVVSEIITVGLAVAKLLRLRLLEYIEFRRNLGPTSQRTTLNTFESDDPSDAAFPGIEFRSDLTTDLLVELEEAGHLNSNEWMFFTRHKFLVVDDEVPLWVDLNQNELTISLFYTEMHDALSALEIEALETGLKTELPFPFVNAQQCLSLGGA